MRLALRHLIQRQPLAPGHGVFGRGERLPVTPGTPRMHGLRQPGDAIPAIHGMRGNGTGLHRIHHGMRLIVQHAATIRTQRPMRFAGHLGIGEEHRGIIGAMLFITHDPAAMQLDHPLTHRINDLLVMRGHHHRGAGAVNGIQHLHDAQRRGRIEITGRLVRKQDLRMIHIGAGNGHTLLLATGQLMRIAFLLASQAYGLQHLRHHRLDRRTAHADNLQRERDVLPYRLVVQQLVILEHETNGTTVLRHLPIGDAPQIVAGDTDLALRGLLLTQQQTQQCGLTGARSTHKEHEIPALDVEVDIVKRRSGALGIDLAHMIQRNQCHVIPSVSVPVARSCGSGKIYSASSA